MAAWGKGPRHRSWASNSNIFGLSCLVVLIIYTAMWFASPTHDVPVEIKALVGIAGGAWFQGITTDKRKRDDDVRNTANRAEAKVDRLTDVAEAEHPGSTSDVATGDVKPGGG